MRANGFPIPEEAVYTDLSAVLRGVTPHESVRIRFKDRCARWMGLCSLVVRFLDWPRADWLQITDRLPLCCRRADQGRSEYRLPDVGVSPEYLVYADMSVEMHLSMIYNPCCAVRC